MSNWLNNLLASIGAIKNVPCETVVEPFTRDIPSIVSSPTNIKMGANSYSNVPKNWHWLVEIQGLPKLVAEGLREYGTLEGDGTLNNKKIVGWADEVLTYQKTPYTNWAADWYNKDSIPWCGLFAALMACRSANGKPERLPVNSYLTALSWAGWCTAVDFKSKPNNIYCGDLAIFTRDGGGHVSIIVAVTQDGNYVACLGGNQSDKVDIKLFAVSRLYAVRRPNYNIKPAGARNIRISSTGVPISKNEA